MMRRETSLSDKRITVRRDGEERVIEAPVGAGFLSLLKMHGFPLVCCNGKGTCGRCRILFEEMCIRDSNFPAHRLSFRNCPASVQLFFFF